MRVLMRNVIALAAAAAFCTGVHAVPEWRTGTLTEIYTDPSDVVLVLSVAGPCGSTMYHIQRTNQNFREFYAALLTAFASGRTVSLVVVSCANSRNYVSHGSVKQ